MQSLAGELSKLCDHHRVARFVSRAFGQSSAVGDFLFYREVDTFQLVFAWEITEHLVAFPDRTGPITSDETGCNMDHCRALHALGIRNHVLRPDYVRPQ